MKFITQKHFRRFIRFFRQHTSNDWQLALARVNMLGTAVTLLLLTICLAGIQVLAKSAFAYATLPYITLAAFAACVLYALDRQKTRASGGLLLASLHVALGIALMSRVGIGAGAAILFSVAVIFTSALYGLALAVLLTEVITVALWWFRMSELHGAVQPTYIFVPPPQDFDTVIAMVLLLHALAIACGVVHHYLLQVSQRLQTAEAEKLQQLYRFAEIGEISTALVHDMANTLSSLNLDIEGIQAADPNFKHVTKKIKQLNKVLHTAREHMNGRHRKETFDLAQEVTHTMNSLQAVAKKARVTLEWTQPPSPTPYYGEKILFQQVLTILMKNALDSYATTRTTSSMRRRVSIILTMHDKKILLTITDRGKGIKPNDQAHIFEPFYSTKKDGMGMGLYLTKRFVEDSFGGSILVQTSRQKTVFSVTLPIKHR